MGGAEQMTRTQVPRIVVHDDIGLAILTSIPFDPAMIITCLPKTRGHTLRKH